MKKFYLVSNPLRDTDFTVAHRVMQFFEENHIHYVLSAFLALKAPDEEALHSCDVMLVIGGDGTILQHVAVATQYDMDIVGINMGKVGFLANLEKDAFEEKLLHIAKGEYKAEERMLIDVFCENGYLATGLNDAVFTKKTPKGTADFKVYVDDVFLAHYSADGLIVAAPTGTTAHYLSAGGTVMNPRCETIGVLPICPHSFHNRGVIISSSETVKVEIDPVRVVLCVDGVEVDLQDTCAVTVARSLKKARFVTFPSESFYTVMIKKIIESNNFRGGIS